MNRRDIRKLEEKKRIWDEQLREFDVSRARILKRVSKELRNMFDWYLFYKPKDRTDKIWHLMEVFFVDVFLLKVLDLI